MPTGNTEAISVRYQMSFCFVLYIQSVTGGMDQTSGRCSLC